jgi:hypothetical protein
MAPLRRILFLRYVSNIAYFLKWAHSGHRQGKWDDRRNCTNGGRAMTTRLRSVAATISACAITLAFSGSAIGGGYRGPELPRSGGPVEAWYSDEPGTLEHSDFAAFETESIRAGSSKSTASWAAPGLPRSGGPVEAWYFAEPDTP